MEVPLDKFPTLTLGARSHSLPNNLAMVANAKLVGAIADNCAICGACRNTSGGNWKCCSWGGANQLWGCSDSSYRRGSAQGNECGNSICWHGHHSAGGTRGVY